MKRRRATLGAGAIAAVVLGGCSATPPPRIYTVGAGDDAVYGDALGASVQVASGPSRPAAPVDPGALAAVPSD